MLNTTVSHYRIVEHLYPFVLKYPFFLTLTLTGRQDSLPGSKR